MAVPLITFAYNRPEHLKKTIDSLCQNKLIEKTPVFVFVDGPKKETDKDKISMIKSYLYNIKKEKKINDISLEFSSINKGLAGSIISGVTKVINKYDKVIVLEDDVITSDDFIEFMLECLDYYKDNDKIFSIGGYTFLKEFPHDYKKDVFLTQRSSSYAWATWADRWNSIDWDIMDYKKFRRDFIKRKSFNRWGNDRASMLDDQMNSRISSWAIRFDYTMWKSNKYNVLPCVSRCKSIGHDGSGTHCGKNEQSSIFQFELVQAKPSLLSDDINIDERIRRQFVKPFKTKKTYLIKRYLTNVNWRINKNEHKR